VEVEVVEREKLECSIGGAGIEFQMSCD
jgi:hypothetical protein